MRAGEDMARRRPRGPHLRRGRLVAAASTTRQHASGSTATAARAKRAWGTAAPAPSQPEAHPRAATTAGDRAAPPHPPRRGVHRPCVRHARLDGAPHLRRCGTDGRLDRGDRSCGPPPKPLRYERPPVSGAATSRLPAIPDGGGWRTHGRGNAGPREGGLALCALRHRRPHPGVLRDPHQRDRRGGVPLGAQAVSEKSTGVPAPDQRQSRRPSTRNGPTPATGTTTPNAATPTSTSCTTTMNRRPRRSPANGTPRWPPSPA